MMKCSEKLGKLIFLERRLEDEFMESRITEFGSRFKNNRRVNKIEISEV